MKENEKHFKRITLEQWDNNLTKATLNDNSFADITFDELDGWGIKRISYKAFGKSAKTIKGFRCAVCELSEAPLEYNVWTTLSQLTEVKWLDLRLNVTQIPSNAFKTNNGAESKIKSLILYLTPKQRLTIQSNAFNNLKQLLEIEFLSEVDFFKIEKSTFNFSRVNNSRIAMVFMASILTGDIFAPGSFDGNKEQLDIELCASNFTYIPESSFKSVLSDNRNIIDFHGCPGVYTSYIDCADCRNLWLITDRKENQLMNAFCMNDPKKTFFDQDIQEKLRNKCK